jgi:CheY-like chemotaxis protein
MDCEMPVLSVPLVIFLQWELTVQVCRDGLSATREIRRMEATGELQRRNTIFALTGNARAGQVENAREAGMDDVIVRATCDRLFERARGLMQSSDQAVQARGVDTEDPQGCPWPSNAPVIYV